MSAMPSIPAFRRVVSVTGDIIPAVDDVIVVNVAILAVLYLVLAPPEEDDYEHQDCDDDQDSGDGEEKNGPRELGGVVYSVVAVELDTHVDGDKHTQAGKEC